MIYLLSEVVKNPSLKSVLIKCADDRKDAVKYIPQAPPVPGNSLVSVPASGSKLSAEELKEVFSLFLNFYLSISYIYL